MKSYERLMREKQVPLYKGVFAWMTKNTCNVSDGNLHAGGDSGISKLANMLRERLINEGLDCSPVKHSMYGHYTFKIN